MTLRDILILCSIPTLIFVGLYYGYRFLRIRNYLLGLEWIILGFSATNMLLYYLSQHPVAFHLMMFCDAFSRTIGIPVIAAMGIMKVVNGYTVSHARELSVFILGAVVAYVARYVPAAEPVLHYAYFALSAAFTLFLLYFAAVLSRRGLAGHAMATGVSSLLILFIASLDGFISIPGEETNLVFNFLFLCHLVWAATFAEVYYAYRALERSNTTIIAPSRKAYS